EIAAIGRAGIFRFLLGELGKIRALLEFFRDRLGLVLGFDQDVPGMNFLFAGDLLGGVLIDLLHGLVGSRRLALARQQAVHQKPVAREGQPLFEILAISIFLSSAALATIFMSIRNASTFSFLVAGSICARLGPSSSSAR